MEIREKLVEQLREVSDLTPPICEYQKPEEIELFGKKVTVYCKPFEQFQGLLREAADYITNGVTVQEEGYWINIPPYRAISGDYNKAQECPKCHAFFVSNGNEPYSNHPYCCECGARLSPQPPKGE